MRYTITVKKQYKLLAMLAEEPKPTHTREANEKDLALAAKANGLRLLNNDVTEDASSALAISQDKLASLLSQLGERGISVKRSLGHWAITAPGRELTEDGEDGEDENNRQLLHSLTTELARMGVEFSCTDGNWHVVLPDPDVDDDAERKTWVFKRHKELREALMDVGIDHHWTPGENWSLKAPPRGEVRSCLNCDPKHPGNMTLQDARWVCTKCGNTLVEGQLAEKLVSREVVKSTMKPDAQRADELQQKLDQAHTELRRRDREITGTTLSAIQAERRRCAAVLESAQQQIEEKLNDAKRHPEQRMCDTSARGLLERLLAKIKNPEG